MSTHEAAGVVVRPLAERDAQAVAALHRQAFRGYFLTHLGQRFLELFYLESVHPPGRGVVAVRAGQVVGFVTGMTDAGFFARFYRRHFPTLVAITAYRFATDGVIRRGIWRRHTHLFRALRSLLGMPVTWEPEATAHTAAAHGKMGYLLSIGVADEARGLGIAELMVDEYCAILARDGCDIVRLTVLPSNVRAIRYYEKSGWQRTEESATSVTFVRPAITSPTAAEPRGTA